MSVRPATRALVAALVIAVGLAACSQAVPPAVGTTPVATSNIEGVTPMVTGVEGHFNPTEATGGGAMGSNTVSDPAAIFAAIPKASQLKISANASPPGTSGPDVTAVSVIAQDPGGVLKELDAASKQSLGDAILTTAGGAWPNATISLLVSSTAGGGSIIGSRPKGGPNTVFAT
jgi:hypothetical protein